MWTDSYRRDGRHGRHHVGFRYGRRSATRQPQSLALRTAVMDVLARRITKLHRSSVRIFVRSLGDLRVIHRQA